MFPNRMMARNIKVTEYTGNHDFDCIIGLDILRMGDMAISNAGNIMVFSFRTPSDDKHIDFTKRT
jgi:hypothetical protein